MLVALLDENNRVLSLGIIQGIDFNSGALKIISKPEIAKATRIIQFGSYRMDGNQTFLPNFSSKLFFKKEKFDQKK
jgi:polynucleotide 5'-kinase involved in rRNA processing